MDSNQKPLPSPPPSPPPPPPPKNGNSRGCPPLISTMLHDEGDGGAVGVGDMEGATLRRGSPRASCHEPSESGRHELSRSGHHELFGSGRHGLPPRHSRVVARLGLAALGTVAAVDDQSYVCADCSMTFGRETALCGHMRSHKRDHLSSDSEEDASTLKRRRKKRKSKLRTVKPLEATWGKHARRNGTPKDAPAEVKVSRSESNVSNEVTKNDRSGDDISVIVIDDDDDDSTPIITIAPSLAPDVAVAQDMAPTPAVAVATPTLAPHEVAASMNTEGAPAAASTMFVTIPPAPNSTVAATITTTPLATTVSAATQTEPDLVKGNNGSGQAGARYRYGGNCKDIARNRNGCGKSLIGNADYGKGVAGYSDADYKGKGVVGCSSGSPTYSTSTAARGEGKVYSCQKCNMFFCTPQALGGHTRTHHRIMEDKEKLDMHSGSLKCKVCNHACHTGQELSFHMRNVHPHPCIGAATSAKEKTSEVTRINKIGAAVDGRYNTMGRHIPTGTPRSVVLALPAPMAPVHQLPQGTMAMVGNRVAGHFLAANTSTGWSLPGTTSSILPAIPLHNQEQDPPEQIAAPGNHGHHNINPALFSFLRRQEMAVVPSNSIASSSSTPRPGVAALADSFQALGINNYFESIDSPANTMGRRLPFYLAGRSDTQELAASWPVHHPTQGMAMDDNPLTGHFPVAISATGWSFPTTTSNIIPAIPLQSQEENPPHGRMMPANGEHPYTRLFRSNTFPTFPSQNQVENPPEEIVPGNNGGHTIRLFGTNIAEGQKEVKEPK